ncbi:hypothetical protein BDW22DRAFT_1420041 [Trametopsis cervina]|nr:hypothetical protein BDW22DRAFT_1420041 [Trametopsis cervina]
MSNQARTIRVSTSLAIGHENALETRYDETPHVAAAEMFLSHITEPRRPVYHDKSLLAALARDLLRSGTMISTAPPSDGREVIPLHQTLTTTGDDHLPISVSVASIALPAAPQYVHPLERTQAVKSGSNPQLESGCRIGQRSAENGLETSTETGSGRRRIPQKTHFSEFVLFARSNALHTHGTQRISLIFTTNMARPCLHRSWPPIPAPHFNGLHLHEEPVEAICITLGINIKQRYQKSEISAVSSLTEIGHPYETIQSVEMLSPSR